MDPGTTGSPGSPCGRAARRTRERHPPGDRGRLISGGPRTCVVARGGANAHGGEQTAAARPAADRAVDSGDPPHSRRHHRRRRLPRRPRFPLTASARSTSDRRAVSSAGRSLPRRASRHPASAERGRRCSRTGVSVSSPGERCQTSAPTSGRSDMRLGHTRARATEPAWSFRDTGGPAAQDPLDLRRIGPVLRLR